MATSVFCIVNDYAQVEIVLDLLRRAGFSGNDISVLLPDKRSTRDFAHEQHTKMPEGATAGAGTGGILGGVVGWLAGIGSLAIPGAGAFLAAGPLMAALSGAAVGAAVGGIAGALVGLGIPEYEAKRYEGKIHGGNMLISVHSDDPRETNRAKQIFEEAHAEDISTGSEAKPPPPRSQRTHGDGDTEGSLSA